MGQVHNELHVASLQLGIRRAVGGDMEVEIERVGETLTPVLDLWTQPDWFFLRNVRRFAISVPLAANVAGIARFQISVPATARVITVIEELSVIENTAATEYAITDTGAFIAGGLAPCSALDSRWQIAPGGGSRPTQTLQTVDNTAAAQSGIIVDRISVPTNTYGLSFRAGVPFTLSPGNYIQVQSNTVNHQCRFQVRGYERTAFPGELSA